MFSVSRIISRFHMAQALRSGVAAATRCSSQLDFGFPFLLEACWMSTRREIIVTTSLSEEIAQHTLDEIEKRVEVGISPKTKEEAKQVISSLTTCLEENKVLLKDAAVALAELRASMSQPDEYVTMEKIRNATKVLQRYDYRAGFWGVVGGQCLGILPPFIEELNYPMPENCAGGKTGVFVNGRELHQKDLRLLIARGLPRDRDRSYTVYITGRVIDEDTGEELDSLGKLAPTVDKLKRGFGMRVPRRHA